MLTERATGPELMDGPSFGRQEVLDTFRYLVPVNRLFGGIQPVLSFLRRESRVWDRGRTYRIFDAGCGSGDMAAALARWARRSGFRLEIDGVDIHPAAVDLARERCRAFPEVRIECRDALELGRGSPAVGPYDVVHASQFLHHFPDDQVVPVLRHLMGLSGRWLVVNDLVRAPLAYLGTWLFTLGTSAVFRHDARLSVRRGFRTGELKELLRHGGIEGPRVEKHFFYRFLLVVDVGQAGDE